MTNSVVHRLTSSSDAHRGQNPGKKQQPQTQKKQLRRQQGLGSGVIVSKDGYI